MTTNRFNPHHLGATGLAPGSDSACFLRSQVVTVAVKVGRPLTLAECNRYNGALKEKYVVEIVFNRGLVENKELYFELIHTSASTLYRNCTDDRIAFSFIRRVLECDGGVGFCCSGCCSEHTVTPLASLFFCAEHYVYPS